MQKTALLLGLHCHQPVDNFHEVLDDAIEKSYLPFFEVASKYPEFVFSVHYSGWLLEYIRDHAPELFSLMQALAKRGQVEFLTGGFYEPILASIPSRDRRAQIDRLSDFIAEYFGQRPTGLWLTERVWDGAIAKDLIKCGVEYVVVDDYHFISSGFDADNLNGYFLTEEEGKVLKLFPINKHLRYQIPFAPEGESVAYLESIADEKLRAGVIFDDGEKFGIWPQTHEWVYEKGWLKRFIEAVLESEKIETMMYREYLKKAKPISLAYLPTTSYFEMGEWSLRPKDALMLEQIRENLSATFSVETIEKFVKGSIWKNFLVKYYESNQIHKRMLSLSHDAPKNEVYLDNLYKAQTNDVLWHGVFGGIYLPNLRDNAWRFIIACEDMLHGKKDALIVEDVNCDGYDEIKCVSENLVAVFDTAAGGALCELGIRDKMFNFANTLTRYEEAYHAKIRDAVQEQKHVPLKEEEGISTIHNEHIENPEQYLPYLIEDWYLKNSFVDHIVDAHFSVEQFHQCSFSEYGDFANQPFVLEKSKKHAFKLVREGGIYRDGEKHALKLSKRFRVKESRIDFKITLEGGDTSLFYLMEHNFHFANSEAIVINNVAFSDGYVMQGQKALDIYDPYTGKHIRIDFDCSVDIYICKLDTLSQSEAGFELTNQGVSFGFKVPMEKEHVVEGRLEIV